MDQSIYTDGRYIAKNPSYHVEDSPWKARQILRMIRRHDLALRSVCEIGCGAGEVLRQLQLGLPDDVIFEGYEISPSAYELSLSRRNPRLHFHCEDLLSTTSLRFDLLLCVDVVEHVEDYFGFLRSLRAKSEYQIFHMPLDLSVQSVLRGAPILRRRNALGHIHYFTQETAIATLIDTGYQVLDHFFTPTDVDRVQSWKSWLAKMPRQLSARLSSTLAARIFGGYSLLVLTK